MSTAAETWNAIYLSGAAMRWWPSEDVLRFISRRLTPGMRVLEVGCGNGANTWPLVEIGCKVVAVDASPVAIDMAQTYLHQRHLGGDSALFYPLALHQLELGWKNFDAIVDCRVSQHTPWSAHATTYRLYAELLKPGGWFFLLHLDRLTSDARRNDHLVTPGEHWTWDNIESGVYPNNGLVCMPPTRELCGVVSEAELKVVRVETSERMLPTEGLMCSHTALDAQKPA